MIEMAVCNVDCLQNQPLFSFLVLAIQVDVSRCIVQGEVMRAEFRLGSKSRGLWRLRKNQEALSYGPS